MVAMLWWILKWGIPVVVLVALIEGLVLTVLAKRRGERYDWIAATISIFDFIVREVVMRLWLPMLIYATLFVWLYQNHRIFTMKFDQWWPGWWRF